MFQEFVLFGKTISPYVIMAIIGALVSGVYSCKKAKSFGHDDNDMITLLLVSSIGVLVGGHLLYGITNYRAIVALFSDLSIIGSFSDFIAYATYIFGGSVFYGGLLGGLLVGSLFAKAKKYPLQDFMDIAAPTISLFHVFGRIGCFLGGCCYGTECSVGIVYRYNPIAAANGVPRLPVQLIESAFNLGLFFVLNHLLKKGKLHGKLIYVYLLSYAAARFFFEFFRGDEYRGFIGGLSTSQLISIAIIAVVTVVLLVKKSVKN